VKQQYPTSPVSDVNGNVILNVQYFEDFVNRVDKRDGKHTTCSLLQLLVLGLYNKHITDRQAS
jgi:hypothetical protein